MLPFCFVTITLLILSFLLPMPRYPEAERVIQRAACPPKQTLQQQFPDTKVFLKVWHATQRECWHQPVYSAKARETRRKYLKKLAFAAFGNNEAYELAAEFIDGWWHRVDIGEPGDGWRMREVKGRFRLEPPVHVLP